MISRFIDYIKIERRYSDLTIAAYEHDLLEFCTYLNVSPDSFGPSTADEADIRSWMISMLDEGLTPRSVRRKLSSLRGYWKFCMRVGLTDKDETQRIVLPKVDKPLPVFFKESEVARVEAPASVLNSGCSELSEDATILQHEEWRDFLIIEMLYETGMRQAELLGLANSSIDLQQAQIRVFGKRRKERIVPVGVHLVEQIREYKAAREMLIACLPESSNLTGESFFIKLDRQQQAVPLTKGALYNIVRARMQCVSTLKKRSPHVLRHTFATTMLNNGADINTIKDLMGHASLAATQVYTHTTFEQIKKTYNQAHPRANRQK